MRLYRSLYSAESTIDLKNFFLTQQISPLIEFMRERLHKQQIGRQAQLQQ